LFFEIRQTSELPLGACLKNALQGGPVIAASRGESRRVAGNRKLALRAEVFAIKPGFSSITFINYCGLECYEIRGGVLRIVGQTSSQTSQTKSNHYIEV
jgi:hypothetical protein